MKIDEITDPYELQNKDNEWVEKIAGTRKTDKKNARQNIKKEQKVQKKPTTAKSNAIGMLICHFKLFILLL